MREVFFAFFAAWLVGSVVIVADSYIRLRKLRKYYDDYVKEVTEKWNDSKK